VLTLVVLFAGFITGAQETGDGNTATDPPASRPAETELLLDDTGDQAEGGENAPAAELPGIGFGDFARMLLVLGFVIALIYAFVWMLKRFSGAKPEAEDLIKLHSTRPLKGDAALHLVEIGNRMFLVGSGGGTLNLISEIDDKESMDEIRLAASQTPEPISGGFARMFKDRFGSGPSHPAPAEKDNPPSQPRDDDPASYLRKQRERLKDL